MFSYDTAHIKHIYTTHLIKLPHKSPVLLSAEFLPASPPHFLVLDVDFQP